MSSRRTHVSRPMVGLCALACFAGAVGTLFVPESVESAPIWQASFLRVGLVMAAFWLALPSKGRDAAWTGISGTTFAAILIAAFLAARYRYAVVPILIGVAIVGAFLRPREKARPGERAV